MYLTKIRDLRFSFKEERSKKITKTKQIRARNVHTQKTTKTSTTKDIGKTKQNQNNYINTIVFTTLEWYIANMHVDVLNLNLTKFFF